MTQTVIYTAVALAHAYYNVGMIDPAYMETEEDKRDYQSLQALKSELRSRYKAIHGENVEFIGNKDFWAFEAQAIKAIAPKVGEFEQQAIAILKKFGGPNPQARAEMKAVARQLVNDASLD